MASERRTENATQLAAQLSSALRHCRLRAAAVQSGALGQSALVVRIMCGYFSVNSEPL